MRSIKEIILPKTGIIKSFNDNKFNLILTPRQWGLTSLLIDYVNYPTTKDGWASGITDSPNGNDSSCFCLMSDSIP